MNTRKHRLLGCFCSDHKHKNHKIKGGWHKSIHLPARWGGVTSSGTSKEDCHNIGDTYSVPLFCWRNMSQENLGILCPPFSAPWR